MCLLDGEKCDKGARSVKFVSFLRVWVKEQGLWREDCGFYQLWNEDKGMGVVFWRCRHG